MIYLYTYLILSAGITIYSAQALINKLGKLEHIVAYLRSVDGDNIPDELTDKQVVNLMFIVGLLLSPIIATYLIMEKMNGK